MISAGRLKHDGSEMLGEQIHETRSVLGDVSMSVGTDYLHMNPMGYKALADAVALYGGWNQVDSPREVALLEQHLSENGFQA